MGGSEAEAEEMSREEDCRRSICNSWRGGGRSLGAGADVAACRCPLHPGRLVNAGRPRGKLGEAIRAEEPVGSVDSATVAGDREVGFQRVPGSPAWPVASRLALEKCSSKSPFVKYPD